eukprot:4011482-Prymnesium_polylepis.1
MMGIFRTQNSAVSESVVIVSWGAGGCLDTRIITYSLGLSPGLARIRSRLMGEGVHGLMGRGRSRVDFGDCGVVGGVTFYCACGTCLGCRNLMVVDGGGRGE